MSKRRWREVGLCWGDLDSFRTILSPALLVENNAELILNVDKVKLASQVSPTLTDDDR